MNYKIKYIKNRSPLYFVNGEWIKRGCVPEVREWANKYRIKNQEKLNQYSKDFYWTHRESECKRRREYGKKYPARTKARNKKYLESEHGYFMGIWHQIRRSKHGHSFKNFDAFYQCWLDQKAVHGMTCPATDVTMTMIKHKGVRTNTNLSVDRILCSRGYSRQNLVFTTWKYNDSKGHISPKGAKSFLRIVRERYQTDDVE